MNCFTWLFGVLASFNLVMAGISATSVHPWVAAPQLAVVAFCIWRIVATWGRF